MAAYKYDSDSDDAGRLFRWDQDEHAYQELHPMHEPNDEDDHHLPPRFPVYTEEQERFIDSNIWSKENPTGMSGIQLFAHLHGPLQYDDDGNISGTHEGDVIYYEMDATPHEDAYVFGLECQMPCELSVGFGPYRRRQDGHTRPWEAEMCEYAHKHLPVKVVEHSYNDVEEQHRCWFTAASTFRAMTLRDDLLTIDDLKEREMMAYGYIENLARCFGDVRYEERLFLLGIIDHIPLPTEAV